MPLGMEVGLSQSDFLLDGDPAPSPKTSPIFGPFLLRPNGWMHQDATWYGVGLSPGDFVFDGDTAPTPQEGGGAPLPNFRSISIVTKRLDASRCHLVFLV